MPAVAVGAANAAVVDATANRLFSFFRSDKRYGLIPHLPSFLMALVRHKFIS